MRHALSSTLHSNPPPYHFRTAGNHLVTLISMLSIHINTKAYPFPHTPCPRGATRSIDYNGPNTFPRLIPHSLFLSIFDDVVDNSEC